MATIVEARPTTTYATPALPKADSCILVIFGATGDLTRRKLIPALYDLACVGCMSPHFDIVGLGRKRMPPTYGAAASTAGTSGGFTRCRM